MPCHLGEEARREWRRLVPILERMRAVESGEAARAEGIRIAQELVSQLRSRVQGIRVTAPLGRYSSVVEVAQALGPTAEAATSSRSVSGEKG